MNTGAARVLVSLVRQSELGSWEGEMMGDVIAYAGSRSIPFS